MLDDLVSWMFIYFLFWHFCLRFGFLAFLQAKEGIPKAHPDPMTILLCVSSKHRRENLPTNVVCADICLIQPINQSATPRTGFACTSKTFILNPPTLYAKAAPRNSRTRRAYGCTKSSIVVTQKVPVACPVPLRLLLAPELLPNCRCNL